MNALKQGTSALNTLHSQMSPEDVEMLLGESEDAINASIHCLLADEIFEIHHRSYMYIY